MAILQLSRITHRKGLADDLPQLAGAELGWVLDERKLYIGNGTVADGAPIIGNTEILTEFSDLLALSSGYTYKGAAAGYVVVTGDGDDIVRSLQSKFDDMASVKDFGAVGDGATDDTAAINRALSELFCREINTEIRRSLFFPAGTYKVTGSIALPPHARLYGEGLTSSIINFVAPAAIAATAITVGTRYAITSVGTTDFTLIGAASNTIDEVFVATGVGTGTGTVREVPAYVVETADSLCQTGSNLGNNGASMPTGIEMANMAIYSTEENTLLKIDSTTNSGFSYLGLHGPRITSLEAQSVGFGTAAIEVASTNATSHDITLSKLDTLGTTYALYAQDVIKGVVFENCGLDYHYIGCNIGTAPVSTGPTGIIINRNIFDNIARQGVLIGDPTVVLNSSAYNIFYDVGNNFTGSPVTPVIQSDSAQFVSVGDLFERSDTDDLTQPRVFLNGNGGIAIDGSHSIHLGSYERQTGIAATLSDNTTDGVIFQIDSTSSISYKIDYNIIRSVETRMGSFIVSANGTVVNYSEDYNESSSLGVTLAAVTTGVGAGSRFEYTTTSTGNDATINYSVIRLD